MAAQIEAVLRHLREHGNFGCIQRQDVTDRLSAQDLMAEAQAVGDFRTPSFTIDDGLRFAYENIAKWVVGDPSMKCVNPDSRLPERGDLTKGLYVAGRTGCGKTWALEIYSYLATAHNIRYITNGRDVLLDMQDFRADEITSEFMRSGDTSLYTDSVKALVINDLGTEPEETLYMGNRVNVLRQILEKRADDPSKLTMITSNIPMGDRALATRYGDRVASRLRQMCNYIEITGNDKRR